MNGRKFGAWERLPRGGGVGNNGVSGQGFAADFRKEFDAMNVIYRDC